MNNQFFQKPVYDSMRVKNRTFSKDLFYEKKKKKKFAKHYIDVIQS